MSEKREMKMCCSFHQRRPWFGLLLGWVGAVVFLGGIVLGPRPCEAQDWSVRNRGRRHRIVVKRFIKIVEQKPERGYAFRRLVKLARRWPGLDRLLAQYKAKTKRYPNRLAYRLILAHLLYVTRQRQEALGEYQNVVKRHPKVFWGHIYLAQLHRQLKNSKKALAAYQKALSYAKRKNDKRRCLKAMGTLALQLKLPKQALKHWQAFFRLSPGNLSAREEMARALVRQKLFDEALKQWRQVLKRSRGGARRSRVWRQIGLVQEQAGAWQKAVKAYRASMGYTRSGHWLRRELNERILQLHRENGKLGELVKFLQKKRRKSKRELAMVARLLDELGRDQEAEGAYKRALRVVPNDAKLRRKFITLLEVRNKTKQAIQQYRELIRREPREPQHRLAFAEMLSRMGRRRESLAQMKTIAKTFSRNSEVLNRLANLYRKRRMMTEAIALYRRLIRVEPRVAAHRRVLGHYYYQQSQEKKALRIWKGILSSGMVAHKAYIVLGQILRDHNMLRKARKWHLKALKARPNNVSYLIQMGELYQRILDEENNLPTQWMGNAIRIWKRIYKKSRLRTRRKRAMQQLFALYHAQGTLYRLPLRYRARLQTKPGDVEALRWLGELELWQAQRRGRRSYYQASYFFRKILKYKPNDLDAILTLEQLAARQRRWRTARGLLLRAVKVHRSGRRGYYRRICDYSLKMGANRDAITYARKAIALNPEDASAHADLARIYGKARQPRKAVAAYKEAIRLRPNSHSYSLALADILRGMGQQRKASELYRHVYKHTKDSRAIFDAAVRAIEILLPMGQSKRLESELQSLADANPRELAYFRALAELYRRQGKMKAYRIAYLKAAATVDQKSQVYKQLAEVAQEQGDLPKAIIYFRKMLEESPNPSPEEQIKLASFYLQTNDKKNSRKILLGLLNDFPTSLRVLRQVAGLLDKYNLHAEAVQAYEMFLELDPQSPDTRMKLASLYQKLQQYEPAIGLLSAVVWGYYDKPIRRKKKVNKKVKRRRTRRRLPYYLRRRRRYSRYRRHRMSYTRRRAMVQLMTIYKKMGRMDQWDQRLLYALKDPATRRYRSYMVHELTSYYQNQQWFDRLRRILEEMKRQEPRNVTWIRRLASLLQKQGRHSEALALFSEMERMRPGTRKSNFFSKLQIAIAMKDRDRVRYLVEEFLHRQVGAGSRTRAVLRLLKQHQYYNLMEKVLKWGLKYSRFYYAYYIRELIAVYLKLGKRNEARKLLLKEWNRPSAISFRRRSLQKLMERRQQLIARLWPLLKPRQRIQLLRRKEQDLLEWVIGRQRQLTRRALVDLYALLEVSQGLSIAQRYLPALWVMTSNSSQDRRMRHRILSKLLQRGEFDVSITLIQQSLKRIGSSNKKLAYLLRTMMLLSRFQLFPPRKFSRFLERQLRNLRTKVNRAMWRYVALQLADRYLAWGDYQRVVWWVALCQWTAPSMRRKDPRWMLRLARAYQRKGNKVLAQRYFDKTTALMWGEFEKNPGLLLLRIFIKKRLMYWQGRVRRYGTHSRYLWSRYLSTLKRYQQTYTWSGSKRRRLSRSSGSRWPYRRPRFRRRSQNNITLDIAKATLLQMYQIYVEAEQKQKLFGKLQKYWRSAREGSQRQRRLFYMLAAYHLDWRKERNKKSLVALLKALRGLLSRPALAQNRPLRELLATLEGEANQFNRSLAQFRKLMVKAKPKAKQTYLRKMAVLYGRSGQEAKQRATHLRLATEFKDRLSDKWLAHHYLEQRRVSQAIRYYQRYLRRSLRSRHRSYQRFRQARQHLNVAKFLLPSGQKQQMLYFALRAANTLRMAGNPNHYQYQSLMQRTINLLLRIGKLRELTQRWEKQRTRSTQDMHLLTMLRYAYRTLEQPLKERMIMAQMLRLRPYDKTLFSSVLHAYERQSDYKGGLTLLTTLYKDRTPKPKEYHLWVGQFHHLLEQDKLAFASWKRQFAACVRLTSSFQQFKCKMRTAHSFLEADGVKQALQLYQRTLRKHNYRYRWLLVPAARLFLKKKAYREVIVFVEAARENSSDVRLSRLQVQFLDVLMEAHKGLQDHKPQRNLIQQLKTASFRDADAARIAARLLEKVGDVLAAERLFWMGQQQARSKWSRQRSHRELCNFWQRHGLGRLCDDEGVGAPPALEQRQRSVLAQRYAQAGFPFLALLQLRKLRLYSPNNPSLWRRMFSLSLEVGRLKEAKLWWNRLAQSTQPPADLAKLKQQLTQAGTVRPTVNHLGRRSWPSVAVPGWCKVMKAKNGKLQTQQCQKQLFLGRCQRRLLEHNGVLITNDCMGRLVGFESGTGRVLWVHELPRLKSIKTQTLSTKRRRSHSGKGVVTPYYRIADLQPVGQGDVVAVVNHIWLARGKGGWASGMHHRMLLLRLKLKDGGVVWKKSVSGGFCRGKSVVTSDSLALVGRTLQVYRLQDGRLLWQQSQGTHASAWLFGSKDKHPLVNTSQGVALAGWDQYLYHYDSKGSLLWKLRFDQDLYGLAYAKSRLYVVGENGLITAVSEDGKPLWKVQGETHSWQRAMSLGHRSSHFYNMMMSPAVVGQQLLLIGTNGYVVSRSVETGRVLWRRKIGDHGPYKIAVDSNQRTLGLMGQEGLLVTLRADKGKPLWKYRFDHQIVTYSSGRLYRATSTPVRFGAKRVWVGTYDSLNQFVLHGLWRKSKSAESRQKRLQQLVAGLHREKKPQLALHVAIQSVDPDDPSFRGQFLSLTRRKRLSLNHQLLWAYRYLASGNNIKRDLAALRSYWSKKTFSFNASKYYQPGSGEAKVALVQWMLRLSDPNPATRKAALKQWLRLCFRANQGRLRMFADSVSRRFASMLLRDKDPKVRLLAAFSLAVWGDDEGRKPLLSLLNHKTLFQRTQMRRLQLLVVRTLLAWDSRLDWEGQAIPPDAPSLLPLLTHSNIEIRLRAALFLARTSLQSEALRKRYDTPKLRSLLLEGTKMLKVELAVLASSSLAKLGDRRGIEHLRKLYNQNSGRMRNRIARQLYSEFNDFWGIRSLLASYQGRYSTNLRLPSFQLIYGSRLLDLQRYNDALYQFQLVLKRSNERITPQHRAMALHGVGQCLYHLKRYKLAEEKFVQAAKLDPFMTSTIDWRARTLFQRKRYKEAKKLFVKAMKAKPYTASLRRYLAVTYFHLGLPKKAHGVFSDGFQYRPDWHRLHAHYAKALFLAPRPRLKRALRELRKALKYEPKQPRYLHLKAQIEYKMKRRKSARKTLQEAILLEAPASPFRRSFIQLYKTWFKRQPRLIPVRNS